MVVKKYKFKQFSLKNFSGFVRELINFYYMSDIRFEPIREKELIVEDKYTLEHLGDVQVKNTFLNVLSKNIKKIKKIKFELFRRENHLPKIEMTFDLNRKEIFIDEIEGLVLEEIEESVRNHFIIEELTKIDWWKYTHPVWWVYFVLG